MVVGQKFEFAFPELSILEGKISVTLLCKLTKEEEDAFAHAIINVEKQLKAENIINLPRANIIFTLDESITLELENHILGSCIPVLIVYPVKRWRDKNMQGTVLIPIVIEELCHCFWDEPDEMKVKHIVMRVLRNIDIFENLTVNDVYDRIYELYNNIV